MGATVAVAGASGYAGGELLRLLAAHPDLEIGPVAAHGSAGTSVTALHPQLTGHPGLRDSVFVPADPALFADADLLFTALPHGESARLAAELPAQLKIIDLAADFRLADPQAWARYYPTPYAGRWTYGLPELPGTRAAIRASSRVAAPGCYATAAILALAPLLAAGLVEPSDIVIVAASGTSGAGRSPRPDLLASEVMGSMSAYQVAGTHRHIPEIEQTLSSERAVVPASRPVTLSFTPTLAPMPRGILATCTARLASAAGRRRIRAARRPRRGLRRGALRPPAGRRALAKHRPHGRDPTPPTCRSRPTRTPAARSPSAPWTTWSRARPARPSRSPTSCSACRKPPA